MILFKGRSRQSGGASPRLPGWKMVQPYPACPSWSVSPRRWTPGSNSKSNDTKKYPMRTNTWNFFRIIVLLAFLLTACEQVESTPTPTPTTVPTLTLTISGGVWCMKIRQDHYAVILVKELLNIDRIGAPVLSTFCTSQDNNGLLWLVRVVAEEICV